ncbi:TetR/AcrR family transcriptional regulator C-terminal ligand-binding domain-containing protein [Streptomyces sp. C10-9-1]|uniref:TetR-like C-terminal domain-containing protein n=1 Tax=Streptomyces sp. C10-9-1 TaxID=1859285 RepID=UPI003D73A425
MSPPAAGRPRDPAIDAAVLSATLDILRERGYSGFTLEAVAARAATTKPTVRRRWPNRQSLVVDALASVLAVPPVPDTGCTRCDLARSVRLLAESLHHRLPPGVLAPLLAECAHDAALHRRLVESVVAPGRQAAEAVVRRAVDRGDLRPDTDTRMLVDLLASTVYQRALLGGGPQEPQSAAPLVDLVLRGAAVDYERLVRISETTPALRHLH